MLDLMTHSTKFTISNYVVQNTSEREPVGTWPGGAEGSQVVESVWDADGYLIPLGGLLTYILFKPVLHNWYNAVVCTIYPVCQNGAYKRSHAIWKGSLLSCGSRFPLIFWSLTHMSDNITPNKMLSVSLKHFLSRLIMHQLVTYTTGLGFTWVKNEFI